MFRSLEYDVRMRPLISSSVATLVAVVFLLVAVAQAQIHGAPASVTSPGFGGNPINGTPPSVTSLGPHGYTPGPPFPAWTGTWAGNGFHHGNGPHHRGGNGNAVTPYLYAYPVPYAVPVPYEDDNNAADAADTDVANDPEYQGGPTVFDRRGAGASSYVPPVENAPAPHADDPDDPPADPEPAQPTVLIFKDGHKLEVVNYAIVGTTLFDLTPGHPRRIALADLNLDATRKLNDDHGVTFQLPPTVRPN